MGGVQGWLLEIGNFCVTTAKHSFAFVCLQEQFSTPLLGYLDALRSRLEEMSSRQSRTLDGRLIKCFLLFFFLLP